MGGVQSSRSTIVVFVTSRPRTRSPSYDASRATCLERTVDRMHSVESNVEIIAGNSDGDWTTRQPGDNVGF